MYKITENPDVVILLSEDGSATALNREHRWWQDYTEWLSLGNTPQPAQSLEEVAISARADIAARRYLAETSGITVSGMFIDTGRDSQALITGAALSAFIDPTYVCNWKTPDGFVQIDAPTLIAVSKAVRQHVQACFDRESELLSALEAGEYAPDMLEKGWPA